MLNLKYPRCKQINRRVLLNARKPMDICRIFMKERECQRLDRKSYEIKVDFKIFLFENQTYSIKK